LFLFLTERERVNRNFEASTAGGGAAVGEAELVFADDPKENRGLAGSVEVIEDEVAIDPELGKGTKEETAWIVEARP
jgi:hypothetical protein